MLGDRGPGGRHHGGEGADVMFSRGQDPHQADPGRVSEQLEGGHGVADGLHARTDGFTSLGVVLGATGVAVGFHAADPLVGLLITAAILLVLRDAAAEVYRRLMDAVDPHLVGQVEAVARGTDGVVDLGEVRLRWIGHSLRAELEVVVADRLTVVRAHEIAEHTEHRLLHHVPRLTAALVHADPYPHRGDHHEITRHHRTPVG
jgi:cation diffusion facilitator family transporter